MNVRCSSPGRRFLLVATTLLLVIAGCDSKSGGGLNNTLVDLEKKLTAAEKKVEDTLEWPPNEESKKKAAYEEFGVAVTEGRKRFDELKAPEGEAAKKFYDAFNDYLKIQEEAAPLYKKYFESDGKIKHDEMAPIREGIDKMRAKRKPYAAKLPFLQQAYAKEAGLQLAK